MKGPSGDRAISPTASDNTLIHGSAMLLESDSRCPCRLVTGDAIDSLDGDQITVDHVHDPIPANP